VTETLSIDIFSDPACPWCLLGIGRLDRALASLPPEVAVEIRHHPFLLDAQAPAEGEDVVEMLTRKYGREPFETWDRIEAEARATGIDLDMRKQKMRYPTQGAEALIMAAAEKGSQHGLARALGQAYYLEARNISDPAVLAEVASGFGFSGDEAIGIATDPARLREVEALAASAGAQGIGGVPFFIFQGKYALSGAQPEAVFNQALQTVLAEAA
jgi:predicted DsbA family dithiol-disulfide isomerase